MRNASSAPAWRMSGVVPYRGSPLATTSSTCCSFALRMRRHGPPRPWPRITVTSANAPGTSRPTGRDQHRSSSTPGLDVTIWTMSRSVRPKPKWSLAIRATFISPSRFFVPDGPQSEPRHTCTPRARARSTSVVSAYSTMFDSGDHTTPPGESSGHRSHPAASTAQQWTPMKLSRSPSARARSV